MHAVAGNALVVKDLPYPRMDAVAMTEIEAGSLFTPGRPFMHTDYPERVMRPGDDIVVLPSGKPSRIAAIEGPNGAVEEAFPPMAVAVSLTDEIDISRGDMIARPRNART